MRYHLRNTLYFVCFGVAICQTNSLFAEQVIGWVNSAIIYPEKLIVNARIDTGAKTSSVRGKSIKLFSKQGEQWLSVIINDKKGHAVKIKHRIVRFVRIKQHKGKPVRRPVIMLGICISNIHQEVEARAGFNYPLLIGRNYLAGNFFVDSANTFTVRPVCNK